jgi:hypothetical protein
VVTPTVILIRIFQRKRTRPQPLEFLGMTPLNRRPDGPQRRPGRFREYKNLLSMVVIEHRIVRLVPPVTLSVHVGVSVQKSVRNSV